MEKQDLKFKLKSKCLKFLSMDYNSTTYTRLNSNEPFSFCFDLLQSSLFLLDYN